MSERAVSAVLVKMKHSCRITRPDGQPAMFAAGASYYVSPDDYVQLKNAKASIPQYEEGSGKPLPSKQEAVVDTAEEIREPEATKGLGDGVDELEDWAPSET